MYLYPIMSIPGRTSNTEYMAEKVLPLDEAVEIISSRPAENNDYNFCRPMHETSQRYYARDGLYCRTDHLCHGTVQVKVLYSMPTKFCLDLKSTVQSEM